MRAFKLLSATLLLVGAVAAEATSAWGFDEAIVKVQSKETKAFQDKLSDHVPLSKPVTLDWNSNLKITLKALEGKTPKRPHQAFLLLRDMDTGLETAFPLSVKKSGKGEVDITSKRLPAQFLATSQPLRATLLIGSSGSSTAFSNHVFNLILELDDVAAIPDLKAPLRYGKMPEIHHIFRPDPESPPKIITLVFLVAALSCVPLLFTSWMSLGANLNHLPKALGEAPVFHVLFFGSILAVEGIFFLYYVKWNLFQTLPVAAIVGLISFISGSRALSEVQERRLAGLR